MKKCQTKLEIIANNSVVGTLFLLLQTYKYTLTLFYNEKWFNACNKNYLVTQIDPNLHTTWISLYVEEFSCKPCGSHMSEIFDLVLNTPGHWITAEPEQWSHRLINESRCSPPGRLFLTAASCFLNKLGFYRCSSSHFYYTQINDTTTLWRVHLQRRCLDVADVAMWSGALWVDASKASPRVDTRRPLATVVILA